MSDTFPQYPYTTFPDEVQAFTTFLDIAQSDVTAYNTYRSAIESGDYDAAQTALQSITNYEQKVITALKLNQMSDTIQAVEEIYQDPTGTSWEETIAALQARWEAIINQFNYEGTWSSASATSYKQNAMVSYASSAVGADQTNYLYIASHDITTTDNPYTDSLLASPQWLRLTMRGVKGDNGTGFVFDFAWSATEAYQANTVVTHNGSWWKALVQSTGQEPSSSSNYWELALAVDTVKIPVQSSQPADADQEIGDLWFQIV